MKRVTPLVLLAGVLCTAAIVDRIAIVIGASEGTQRSIIKDSDIDQDLRLTSFLNGETLAFGDAARKKSASRLIDQVFIRREIEVGDYTTATLQQADQQLSALVKQKYRTETAFRAALDKYGLTELDLRLYLQWQLTILHFIEVRFKPAVMISDDDVEKYYKSHLAALQHANSGKSSLDDLRQQIRDTLTGERVNEQFFSWLDEQRKNIKIQFREESLS